MFKNRLVYFLFLTFGIYLVVGFSRSIYELTQKTRDIDLLKNKVEMQLGENKRLNEQLNEAKSPEFIERQARERLNMAQKGETVVVIPSELIAQISSKEATLAASFFDRPEKVPNWKQWWRLFW